VIYGRVADAVMLGAAPDRDHPGNVVEESIVLLTDESASPDGRG
jgi:hypothetical protein